MFLKTLNILDVYKIPSLQFGDDLCERIGYFIHIFPWAHQYMKNAHSQPHAKLQSDLVIMTI